MQTSIRIHRPCFRWTCHALLLTLSPVLSPAWAGDADDLDRHFTFIEQSTEATELFNTGRFTEAREIFQHLFDNHPDLDDGYVATSVGDCFAAEGLPDQAFEAYTTAKNTYADIAATIETRLTELELLIGASQELIDQLRARSFGSTDESRVATWRLGRALQGRAVRLLIEAADAFRFASRGEPLEMLPIGPGRSSLKDYTTYLESASQELQLLIDRMETLTTATFRPGLVDFERCNPNQTIELQMTTEDHETRWAGTNAEGRSLSYRIRIENDSACLDAVVNDQKITLTQQQMRLIMRYQERIGTILEEAAERNATRSDEQ